MKEQHKLTPNEWRIYEYIKERSIEEKWTLQHSIKVFMLMKYGENIPQRSIRKAIKNIRACDAIQKVIISGKNGYKLLSKAEDMEYLVSRKIELLASLKQYHKDIDKLRKNGQKRFVNTEYERDFVESILPTNQKVD